MSAATASARSSESGSVWIVERKIERSGRWLSGLNDGGNVNLVMTRSGSLRGTLCMMAVDRLDAVVVGRILRVHLRDSHCIGMGIGVGRGRNWIRAMRPGFGQAVMNNELRL